MRNILLLLIALILILRIDEVKANRDIVFLIKALIRTIFL